MRLSATYTLFVLAPIFAASDAICQRPAQWTVDAKAAVTIGASEDDTTDLLTTVVGATRLPDGKISIRKKRF